MCPSIERLTEWIVLISLEFEFEYDQIGRFDRFTICIDLVPARLSRAMSSDPACPLSPTSTSRYRGGVVNVVFFLFLTARFSIPRKQEYLRAFLGNTLSASVWILRIG